MNVAEKIYKQMVVKGMNQKALARASGISDSEVSRILRGKSSPSLEYASRMARALGVSLDYLGDETKVDDTSASDRETGQLNRELGELVENLGARRARRLLETAADLGFELAIGRLLGVEIQPLIEPAPASPAPLAKRASGAQHGAAGRANSA